MGEEVSRDEAIRQLTVMIKETEGLSEYFSSAAMLGGTVPVPYEFLIKLSDCLGGCTRAMKALIEKEAT